jgi:hypothetical protein
MLQRSESVNYHEPDGIQYDEPRWYLCAFFSHLAVSNERIKYEVPVAGGGDAQ